MARCMPTNSGKNFTTPISGAMPIWQNAGITVAVSLTHTKSLASISAKPPPTATSRRYHGHNRLGNSAHGGDGAAILAIRFTRVLGGVFLGGALAQIAAARKAVARTAKNDRANFWVLVGSMEAIRQQIHHGGVNGIFLFGLVQIHNRNAVFTFFHVDHIGVFAHSRHSLDGASGNVATLVASAIRCGSSASPTKYTSSQMPLRDSARAWFGLNPNVIATVFAGRKSRSDCPLYRSE